MFASALEELKPTGRISTGPLARYIERDSSKTVATMLWPVLTSASSSGSKMGYYTSVSMTLAFYDVPAGAPGIAR
jgi:hypothetical protein